MYAHKIIFINGLYRAHSVRPDSIHPDKLGFETATDVRPLAVTDLAVGALSAPLVCPTWAGSIQLKGTGRR